jgi:hypothetical protein
MYENWINLKYWIKPERTDEPKKLDKPVPINRKPDEPEIPEKQDLYLQTGKMENEIQKC